MSGLDLVVIWKQPVVQTNPPTMKNVSVPERLSLMWVVVMLNMIFADIFSITVVLAGGSPWTLPGDARTLMAIAAIVTNIPILMVYLSRVLPYRANRITNLVAAVLTLVYIVGGGDTAPHYLFVAAIEGVFLAAIFVYALKWKEEAKTDVK